MRRLQKEGLITLKALFIDGTKIGANANRYMFVMKTQMFEDELYYICHDGGELHHIRTEIKE